MSKEYPLVTVVTATYRKFDSLYESIDSVFKQDYPNIEYIICDDGSEDFPIQDITNHIQKTNNKNIKNVVLLTSEKNRGTVKNLNNAYKKAKGAYFVNLSCGDVFFSSDVISKIVDIFLNEKCDVIVTSRILYKNNYEPISLLPHYDERKIIETRYNSAINQYKALILGMFYDMASGSAMYYSRAILEKYGYFDERYTLWEDGPFLSKFLLDNKLRFAFSIISIWYQTGGMSNTKTSMRNPIYQKDIDLFNSQDRKAHLELFSSSELKMLQFCYAKLNKQCFRKNIVIVCRCFPQFLKWYRYRLERKRRIKNDLKYIQTIKVKS